MNLIENWILEVLEESEISSPIKDNRKWVFVKTRENSYGNECVREHYYPIEMWEEIKRKGYYLG